MPRTSLVDSLLLILSALGLAFLFGVIEPSLIEVAAHADDLDEYRAFDDEKKPPPKPSATSTPIVKQLPVAPKGQAPTVSSAGEKDVALKIQDVLDRAKEMLGPELNTVRPQRQSGRSAQSEEAHRTGNLAVNPDGTLRTPKKPFPESYMPEDPRFWSFKLWYQDHVVLNLIVNGSNEKHLLESLRELQRLRDSYDIPVGAVVVVGSGQHLLDVNIDATSGDASKSSVKGEISIASPSPTEFAKMKKALFLEPTELYPGSQILSRIRPENSPTWVVRYHGEDFVFDGVSSPAYLFPGKGKFLAPSRRSDGTPRPTLLQFSIGDSEVPIVSRTSRDSGIRLTNPVGSATSANVADWTKMQRIISLRADESAFPPNAGTYDILPPCRDSKVSRERVYHHTIGTNAMDITYYDLDEKTQAEAAARWPGVAIPFIPTAFVNPFYQYDRVQTFARTIKIRCTPSRFRFVTIGRDRFMETREGAAAWQDGDGSFHW